MGIEGKLKTHLVEDWGDNIVVYHGLISSMREHLVEVISLIRKSTRTH